MRVPLPLVSVVGCKELKLSLHESRRQAARLKSAVLAFHIRGFFAYLQRAMRNLSRTEVLRLVENWRAKMIARDSEVRRLIETGLSSYSLMQWADSCDATGDQFADLTDKILPITPGDDQRQPLRGPRLQEAFTEALELATTPSEPEDEVCDWLPVIDHSELPNLDEVLQRASERAVAPPEEAGLLRLAVTLDAEALTETMNEAVEHRDYSTGTI